jgi:hypothetical protein
MKPNMKDVIKHLARGEDPLTAWNKAIKDGQKIRIEKRPKSKSVVTGGK